MNLGSVNVTEVLSYQERRVEICHEIMKRDVGVVKVRMGSNKYSKYSSGGISGLKPPQFPTVPKIEVPKIEMPKISVPSISLPKPVKKPMDESTAESVVKRWQQIKAKALGSSHDSRALSNILDGPMLRQWTLRAEDVASHGWCWEYELNKLVIEKIEIYVIFLIIILTYKMCKSKKISLD